MLIAGYIATPLQPKTADGKTFHQFRLAVLSGRPEARKTTWFTVNARLSELDADLLDKGMRVECIGVLTVRPYLTRAGEPAADAVITANVVRLAPLPAQGQAAPASAPEPAASLSAAAASSVPVTSSAFNDDTLPF